jgi:hypothetical protein
MTAMAIFMGLCVLGMLFLSGCLFAWFKEPAVGDSSLVKLRERLTAPSESYSAALPWPPTPDQRASERRQAVAGANYTARYS